MARAAATSLPAEAAAAPRPGRTEDPKDPTRMTTAAAAATARSPLGRLALGAGAVLLLAACQAETPPPPPPAARSAAAPRAAADPAQTGPVTAFDGRYSGTMTLNPDRTRLCQPAPAGELEITVRQGQASFVVNPATRQTLSGGVGRDGQARMSDVVDRAIATSGVFTPRGFIGEHRNGPCSYAVNMRRDG
jgi:hypothetical protein